MSGRKEGCFALAVLKGTGNDIEYRKDCLEVRSCKSLRLVLVKADESVLA